MADASRKPSRAAPSRWQTLAAVYALAVALGVAFGWSGRVPFADRFRHSTSSPLARVGLALRETTLELDAVDRAKLRADVDTVSAGWDGERDALELVAALRGLTRDGQVDWNGAEQRCKALRWPRCDRPALEEIRARSRP